MFGWVGLLFRIQSPLFRQYKQIANGPNRHEELQKFLDTLSLRDIEKLCQECLIEMEDEVQQMTAAKARAELESKLVRLGFGDN